MKGRAGFLQGLCTVLADFSLKRTPNLSCELVEQARHWLGFLQNGIEEVEMTRESISWLIDRIHNLFRFQVECMFEVYPEHEARYMIRAYLTFLLDRGVSNHLVVNALKEIRICLGEVMTNPKKDQIKRYPPAALLIEIVELRDRGQFANAEERALRAITSMIEINATLASEYQYGHGKSPDEPEKERISIMQAQFWKYLSEDFLGDAPFSYCQFVPTVANE